MQSETGPVHILRFLRISPPPAFRPFDKLRDHKLKDLPRLPPKFVEPVETNPEVTPTFAPLPALRPSDM